MTFKSFTEKVNRKYILAGLAILILGVYTVNTWLVTCGFEGCPRPSEIRSFSPDEGGKIYDRNGRLMGRLATVRRVNVPLVNVPEHVRQAFIATEDRRFYKHKGLDWRGFLRATVRNVKSFGIREGFSTITMQVARNTFAASKFKERSLRKKLIELRLAKLLEKSLTKDQILELYLNVIYLGNGMYGVEAASRDLFGKSVSRLSIQEGAMLAALPKGPSAYTPRRNPKKALGRRNLVLELMEREGYVSKEKLPALKNTRLRIAKNEWRPSQQNDSYALDAVRALVDSVLKEGAMDVAEVTVYTTLDARAQIAADRAVRQRAAAIQPESRGKRGEYVQGAMIAIDPRSGDIRALVGGRRYERGNFNRAISAKRQPGSAFKPFVYAAALEAGYTPASEVRDEPVDVYMGSQVWSPANYNNDYGGPITFRRALMRSANAATVRVSQVVGMARIVALAHRNGIQSELVPNPAAALGAVDVTPLELVTAYAPFSNGGYRVKPRLVRRIEAADGTVLWSNEGVIETEREQVLDPMVAYQITSMLRAVVDHGTGNVIRSWGVRGPVAGKTGTTNNGADVWFVGYTPTIVAAFWFGYDEPRPVSGDASGGRLAAPAWAQFYTNGWRDDASSPGWTSPAGMVQSVIDAQTGYLANEFCPTRQTEWFKPGTQPNMLCPVHTYHIDEGYGEPGDTAEPREGGLEGWFRKVFGIRRKKEPQYPQQDPQSEPDIQTDTMPEPVEEPAPFDSAEQL